MGQRGERKMARECGAARERGPALSEGQTWLFPPETKAHLPLLGGGFSGSDLPPLLLPTAKR